jgi:hypothetical protein
MKHFLTGVLVASLIWAAMLWQDYIWFQPLPGTRPLPLDRYFICIAHDPNMPWPWSYSEDSNGCVIRYRDKNESEKTRKDFLKWAIKP